jgi:hypothetical protein
MAEGVTLVGVSTVYYPRSERGNLVGVSDSVLDAVAGGQRAVTPRGTSEPETRATP